MTRNRPDGTAIVVGKDSPIKTVADLAGSGWPSGRAPGANNWRWPRWTARDQVNFLYLNALDASHALEGGAVDAIATWEPYVTQAQRQGAWVLTTAEGLIPAQSFVVANQGALDAAAKHAAIADFLQRLQRARTWANADPQHTRRYAAAWAERTRADPAIAQAWFARARTRVGLVTPAAIAQAQRTVDFFASEGLVQGYDVSRLFYDGFAQSLAEPAQTAQR